MLYRRIHYIEVHKPIFSANQNSITCTNSSSHSVKRLLSKIYFPIFFAIAKVATQLHNNFFVFIPIYAKQRIRESENQLLTDMVQDSLTQSFSCPRAHTVRPLVYLGEGYSQKNWVEVCRPLPKNLTLFMTKICDIPYPIYDLTKNSKPY